MTVLSFVADDKFIIRISKYIGGVPDRKWTNSYELAAVASGGETDLLDAATKLVEFEANITYQVVTFDRVLVSTWIPDSVPYNPSAFIASTLTQEGILSMSGSQLEPINMCLDVRRNCTHGRFGHLFYRGALVETMVESPSGRASLASRSTVQGVIDTAISTSHADDLIGSTATPLKLVMINKTGSEMRDVIGLQAAGVSIVPFDHTWFNRRPRT
jgi:hypothetical protein